MSDIIDRNVFLLGAGFSRPAGAPLIYDFLERSRELLNNPPDGLDQYGLAQFEAVLGFKREMAKAREKINIDLDNIEELFGLIEMSFRLGETPKSTRDSMVYTIAKTLELCILSPGRRMRIGVPVTKGDKSPYGLSGQTQFESIGQLDSQVLLLDMYDFFALFLAGRFDQEGRRKFRKDTVITFNYDLVLDDALLRLGMQPLYGHEGQEGSRADGVTLLKLHGSAN